MKKYILYLIVPLMLMAACTSGPAEGSLYHRYADRKGLSVAEVDGFQLCDTVRVDVVMLQTDSDEAWREMLAELSIKDTTGVTRWLGDIDEPAQRTTWDGAPVFRVIASHDKHAIGFYRLENEVQYNALLDYQLNKIKK